MHVVRFAEAPGYVAPGHHDIENRRLTNTTDSPVTVLLAVPLSTD